MLQNVKIFFLNIIMPTIYKFTPQSFQLNRERETALKRPKPTAKGGLMFILNVGEK